MLEFRKQMTLLSSLPMERRDGLGIIEKTIERVILFIIISYYYDDIILL